MGPAPAQLHKRICQPIQPSRHLHVLLLSVTARSVSTHCIYYGHQEA